LGAGRENEWRGFEGVSEFLLPAFSLCEWAGEHFLCVDHDNGIGAGGEVGGELRELRRV
jgi:hypothetical protein